MDADVVCVTFESCVCSSLNQAGDEYPDIVKSALGDSVIQNTNCVFLEYWRKFSGFLFDVNISDIPLKLLNSGG